MINNANTYRYAYVKAADLRARYSEVRDPAIRSQASGRQSAICVFPVLCFWVLFLGDPDIKVPAHGKQTLGPVYLALQAEQAGAKVFGITGHTHQWGTNVTVSLADSKDGPDKVLYDVPNWQWSEPETVSGGVSIENTFERGTERSKW